MNISYLLEAISELAKIAQVRMDLFTDRFGETTQTRDIQYAFHEILDRCKKIQTTLNKLPEVPHVL